MVTTNETKKRGRPRKTQDTQGQMSIFTGSEAGREARAVITAASQEQTITQVADAVVGMYDGAMDTIEQAAKNIRNLCSSKMLDKSILPDLDLAQEAIHTAAVTCSHLAIKLRRAAEAYKADTERQERVQDYWTSIYTAEEDPSAMPAPSEKYIAAMAEYYGLPADDPDFSLEEAEREFRQAVKKAAFANAGIDL